VGRVWARDGHRGRPLNSVVSSHLEMRVEPNKPRFLINRSGSTLAVSVPARWNWFVPIFLTAWLVGWSLGGATAVEALLRADRSSRQALIFFWLIGWLCGELYAIATLAWQLAGREELTFAGGHLRHRVSAAGIGRSREFDGAEIKRLRAVPRLSSPWIDQGRWMPPLFGAGHGAIEFDYGAKTYRIGAALDEAEASLILVEVQKQFPRMVEGKSSAA
jgi:hypothetical protein